THELDPYSRPSPSRRRTRASAHARLPRAQTRTRRLIFFNAKTRRNSLCAFAPLRLRAKSKVGSACALCPPPRLCVEELPAELEVRDFLEVVAHDGERNSFGEGGGVATVRTEKEFPIFQAIASADSLHADRIHESDEIREFQLLMNSRLVMREKFEHAAVVNLRIINRC